MALTAKQVQFMQPDPAKRLEIPAGPPKGLYLMVQPTGAKSWSFRYRFEGRTRKLTLSKPYPDLTLAAARAEGEAALADLKAGLDPGRKPDPEPEPEPKPPDSFRDVAAEFVERWCKARNRAWREQERTLKKDPLEEWGDRPVPDITRADVLRLLDRVNDRGAPIMANRLHATLTRLFGWCVERGIVAASPIAGIRPPSEERSRDRVLNPEELGEVWNASEGLGYPFGPLFRLLILTAQRRGEVAAMRWRDVDLDAALWTLPKEAVKAARAHDVPLAPAVVELLEALPRFDKGDYVLTTESGEKPVNGFSKAKKRLDAAIVKARKDGAEKRGEDTASFGSPPRWTMHDLRRTAATHMARANVPPHVLAALLNHTPGRTLGISAIYIRHRYLAERREALENWADYVCGLVKSKERREAV
jgi:integrase